MAQPESVHPLAGRFSRRQILRASLGATAGLIVAGRAVAASVRIDGSAGALSGEELAPAVRIPPPTTVPAVPALIDVPEGKIMFPIATRPDECWITDNFGACRSNCTRRHEGLDIQGNRDADIFAVVTGRLTNKYVATPGATDGAGNGWTLRDEATNITYKFFHMATHTPGLAVGQIVQQGTVIGTVGNTGTSGALSDTNHHLHFEYRPNNVAQDPRPLLVRDSNCVFYGE